VLGRALVIKQNNLKLLLMTPKWNVIALAAIFVILVVFLAAYDLSLNKTAEYNNNPTVGSVPAQSNPNTPATTEPAVPVATGNVDDIAGAVILDAQQEQQAVVSGLAGDAALYGTEGQEISDLSSVYAGNEF
jgi:hypothetical protein